jgi:molybdate-binding protein/transcriptional regulator with XRE-family HTH domain
MSALNTHGNRVKELREARGWSQAELAERTGISRTGVSAIEGGRSAPSVAAALAIASALQASVEELFGAATSQTARNFRWAWMPLTAQCRYWAAEVGGQGWLFPAEHTVHTAQPHDGVLSQSTDLRDVPDKAKQTLVIACCDPAAALLAREYENQTGFRMVILVRSSGQAIEMVEQGMVHVAGIHWAESSDRRGNAGVLQERGMQNSLELMHVTVWEDGLAIRDPSRIHSIRQASKADLRWIGRAPGAGARRCQDLILGNRKSPAKTALDHRGVVEAIRGGWADVGVCVRLASEEARLGFIAVSKENYDLCYLTRFATDPRLIALRKVVRSRSYRTTLLDLPGYDPRRCGQVEPVTFGS